MTGFDGFSSAHRQTTLDAQSLLHRQRTSTASHQLTDGLRWTLNHCCIDDGPRRLLIMCYGADRLARCEAKNGKVREKQAPQCCTGFKACFSTQLTDGPRWTLDHCGFDDGLRRLLISSPTDYAGDSIAAASTTDFDGFSSSHRRTTLDAQSWLHRQRTSTASHQLADGLRSVRWTLDNRCIDNGPRRLLIMCYGTDRLARCKAKNGKVRKKQAPQCCTDFKACFSVRRTTLDARSLLHRRRTSTASQQALGGGARERYRKLPNRLPNF
jgi:hypothetical protein